MPKLGFSLEMQYDRSIEQVIHLLCDAGFSAISPLYGQDLDTISACAKQCNITVQSLHAPPKGMAALWQTESSNSPILQKDMMDSLTACARFEIPILVAHGWQGHGYTFPETALDFRFFDSFVQQAQQLGVTIAFENLEGEEYLAALMDRYKDLRCVGFCWDSGHDRCYPHEMDFLHAYGNRLMMTHLNDNFGVRGEGYTSKDDLHLLPYDGNTDWSAQINRLQNTRRQDTLNFELKTISHGTATYPQWTLEQFVTEAANRAHKIAQIYDYLT